MINIPNLVAFALQADGWYLRSDIIWAKPNPMPESVTDRPAKSHEHLFLLSKSEKYYYDNEAIKEPVASSTVDRLSQPRLDEQAGSDRVPGKTNGPMKAVGDKEMRNKRDVWFINTEACPHAHFATFPTKLVNPCILAGTSEKGQCPECGKPWVRETETVDESDRLGSSYHNHKDNLKVGQRGIPESEGRPTIKTLGWLPDCECGGDPVPQIVLDPFCGKGTTAKRAKELGRSWLTCDLNPDYCKLAEQELCQEELAL